MSVNCNDASEAVDRVSTISTEKSRAIKLHLSNNNLVLSANSPESGTAIEELELNYNGEMIEIGFNSRYFLDIANQIEGENVEFRWQTLDLPQFCAIRRIPPLSTYSCRCGFDLKTVLYTSSCRFWR